MSPIEIVAIVAMTGYAIYKQTVVSVVATSNQRFKLAIIYGIIGLIAGGFALPHGFAGSDCWSAVWLCPPRSVCFADTGRTSGWSPTAGSSARATR